MGEYETAKATSQNELTFEEFRRQVLDDYRLAVISREASLLGRKEVLRGKAKFGIFGDGKEIAQIAMSKFFGMVIGEADIIGIRLLLLQPTYVQYGNSLRNCMPILTYRVSL